MEDPAQLREQAERAAREAANQMMQNPAFLQALADQLAARAPTRPVAFGANLIETTQEPAIEATTSTRPYKRKAMHWPAWNGEAKTFYFYLNQLIYKYNTDSPVGFIGADRVAWYEILQTLPDDKKQRIESFWTSGGPEGKFDPRELFNHLAHTFGSIHEKKSAQGELRGLTQKDGQPLGDFLPAFEDIIDRAGGRSWDNDSRLTWLQSSLAPTLVAQMVSAEMPGEYYAYVRRLHEIAWNWEQTLDFKALNKRWRRTVTEEASKKTGGSATRPPVPSAAQTGGSGGGSGPNGSGSGSPEPTHDRDGDVIMAAGRTQYGGRRNQGRGSRQNGPDSRRRAKWVTQEERDRRREQGLCLRCGDSTHRVARCPHAPAQDPAKKGIRVQTTHVGPVLEDDEDDTAAPRLAQGKE
jgi:hypothetical protein